MPNRNTIVALIGGVIIIIIIVYAWSTPAPCVITVIPAGVDTVNCPAGGSICGGTSGHCAGTWPRRKYCTTVFITGGTCACRCL